MALAKVPGSATDSPVQVQAPVVQAVLVGEAMFIPLILFVPAPVVLMVEAMFNPLVVPPLLALVEASVKERDTKFPVSFKAVWT